MNEDFKKNIFLKSILVLVIGVFIFDLFFSFITGSGNYYSFKGLINELLVLLIKILVVLFLIIVIAVLTKWLKEIYVENINTEIFRRISKVPVFKLSIIMGVILVGLIFLFGLSNSFTITNNGMNMGGMAAGHYSRSNLGINISSLMALIIKLLIGILFVSFTFGCFMYLKEQYDKGNMNSGSSTNDNNNTKNNISLNNNKMKSSN